MPSASPKDPPQSSASPAESRSLPAGGGAGLFALTALVMCAFAANSLLNRAALQDGTIGPLAFAAIRLAAGAATLALIATLRNGARWLRRMRPAGVGALALYVLGFSLAYVALDTGAGALILFAGVQITMFGGALLGGESVPLRRWLGAAAALAGLCFMFWPGEAGVEWRAGAMMAAAAFGWGVYSLIGRGATDPLGITAASFLGALPIALLALVLVPIGAPPASSSGIWLAVVSGAITSGLGYALWYSVLPRLGASAGALAQLTVPVIAVLGGALLLGEALSLRLLAACALVIGGVTFGMLPRR